MSDLSKMSREELEAAFMVVDNDRRASIASLRLVSDEIDKINALVRDTASVDPDVVAGWRQWVGKLQDEIDYWSDLATTKAAENQHLKATEKERYGRLQDDLGRAYEAIELLIGALTNIQEQSSEPENVKKAATLRNIITDVEKLADDALSATEEFSIPAPAGREATEGCEFDCSSEGDES